MTLVKICGITNEADANLAISLGADALGFNFYKKSPRYIEPKNAKSILSELPKEIWKVGLFVNSPLDEVNEIIELAGIETLQFHGDEDLDYISRFKEYRRIKAIKLSEGITKTQLKQWLKTVDYLLVDASVKDAYGGTGIEIEDDLLKKALDAELWQKTLLAGGLSSENVARKIALFSPFGVDVASGVERSPGRKDPQLISDFIKAVKTI